MGSPFQGSPFKSSKSNSGSNKSKKESSKSRKKEQCNYIILEADNFAEQLDELDLDHDIYSERFEGGTQENETIEQNTMGDFDTMRSLNHTQ